MQLPGEFSPFIEKKVVFCLVVGGVTPPTPLVVRPLKKKLFLCVSSLSEHYDFDNVDLEIFDNYTHSEYKKPPFSHSSCSTPLVVRPLKKNLTTFHTPCGHQIVVMNPKKVVT